MEKDERLRRYAVGLFLNALLLANHDITDEEYLRIKKRLAKEYQIE